MKLLNARHARLWMPALCLLSAWPARAQEGWRDDGEYRIRKALYGTAQQHVDVTAQLRELASGHQRVQVGNQLFGQDPAPGVPKILRLVAKGRGGRTRVFEFAEGDWIDGSLFSGWRQGDWGSEQEGWGGAPGYEDGGRGEWLIERARWGSGARSVDVTARVRELAAAEQRFRVSNQVFGRDPARGEVKTLRIEASQRGRATRVFEYPEGAWVEGVQFGNWGGAPQRPSAVARLEILRAEYRGSYGRSLDVTQLLRERVQSGRLVVRVDNRTLGGDPAPGQPKRLWIEFRAAGSTRTQQRAVNEHDTLTLP